MYTSLGFTTTVCSKFLPFLRFPYDRMFYARSRVQDTVHLKSISTGCSSQADAPCSSIGIPSHCQIPFLPLRDISSFAELPSGNFLHVPVSLKLTHLCLLLTFKGIRRKQSINITFNMLYQCRSRVQSHVCNSHFKVSKARDGVWHRCTVLFSLFYGMTQSCRLKTSCVCPPFCF